MNTLRARCGSCEHIWDILEFGFNKCPVCGSNKIDPKGLCPIMPVEGQLQFPTEIDPGNSKNSFSIYKSLNRITKWKLLQDVLVAVVWPLLCATKASLFVGLNAPVTNFPISWFFILTGAALAAKIVLVIFGKFIIKTQLSSDLLLLPKSSLQNVGYCFIEALLWMGFASLFSIWDPTAAIYFLLICQIYQGIIFLSVLTQLLFRIKVDSVMIAVYAIVLASSGYRLLNHLASL